MSGEVTERADLSAKQQAAGTWAGPRWLWFGVLGGAMAWVGHLFVAWFSVELACTQGGAHIVGLTLSAVVWLATVAPAIVAAAALAIAGRATVVLRHAEQSPPAGASPRWIGRARLLAEVGVWMDALSLLMIIFGGIAVAAFVPCAR